ncbi:hypothetical protein BCR43DRAFT_494655 [Syncephalastrum racemosum]|uniref:N-alpha-acetyltransferase 40 n=1 Tax=Syncephalastrum racemosum TaxID=13706 RepID=A0A1X2H8J0_SYNRA|nr:hypothetical protein BCR43DRAFT_494655 [Syncephalastrum racemosum]
MYTMYAESKDGWNDAHKKKEMRVPEARYLIARSADEPHDLKGFLYFQLLYEETMDDNVMAAVAYCFELQIAPAARNQGIGEFLLQLLCHIGHHWNMEKVMLTVFKANERAMRFYTQKLGFDLDEISPGKVLPPSRMREFDYEILSRSCRAPAFAEASDATTSTT